MASAVLEGWRRGESAVRTLVPARSGLACGRDGVRSLLWAVNRETRWTSHDHDDHEFVHVLGGSLTVEAGGVARVVAPTVGVWLPAGVAHGAAATPGTSFYCVYVQPELCPIEWSDVVMIAGTPLLGPLISYLHRADLPVEHRAHALRVFYDVLQPLTVGAMELPMPTDDRARSVAVALLADPGSRLSIDQWARRAATSSRTLTRVFASETGMTFAEWRVQARLSAALRSLSAGVSISQVARSVGYRSTSAFTATFRRTVGITPSEFCRRVHGGDIVPVDCR